MSSFLLKGFRKDRRSSQHGSIRNPSILIILVSCFLVLVVVLAWLALDIILAGASLGAITEKYPAWSKTFWGHLDVAIQLHHINKVIVMDHRDCGAYKVILEKDFYQDPVKETAIHSEKLNELRRQIKAKYHKLEVELLLMDLDGKVENIVSKG